MVSPEISKDLFLFYGVYDTNQLLKNDLGVLPTLCLLKINILGKMN